MIHSNCPCCLSNKTEHFYTVENAPIQSVVTAKSREKALAIPRKDITLEFCNNCGFIFNSSFDDGINFFSNGYEDQQGFSDTFNKFLNDITSRFINKYNVFGKDILEIGCGKGDFLSLICEMGNNRGIGIDPAYVQGRIKADPNVTFIKEFFSEKHADLPKDVIACRHTLEHIQDTDRFIRAIRKTTKGEKNTIVIMEVPSIVRILNTQAFWDIFYEHCGYFSPGSLVRLFKRNQFKVLDTYLEYDNQYLIIEATPQQPLYQEIHSSEESIQELKTMVHNFVLEIDSKLTIWKERLQHLKEQNKRVVLWGGGSKAVGFLTQFDNLKVINYVVDINPRIQGNYIPGIGIQYVHPNFLREYKPDSIIIMNGVYENEISNVLSEMSLFPELFCL